MSKEIEVSNCKYCPFSIIDKYHDADFCSVSDEVTNALGIYNKFPDVGVHELCPLRNQQITVSLK